MVRKPNLLSDGLDLQINMSDQKLKSHRMSTANNTEGKTVGAVRKALCGKRLPLCEMERQKFVVSLAFKPITLKAEASRPL